MNFNEKFIAEYLLKKIGNKYGVFGLMGNLKAESGCNPKNLQNSYEKKLGYTDDSYTTAVDRRTYKNFVKDSAGYGLAQWTYYTRKQRLLDYAKSKGKSIGDLETQLEFLIQEIQGYTTVWKVLTTAKSVYEASTSVLTGFERPADQSEAVKKKRSSYGEAYYKEYYEMKEAETKKENIKTEESKPTVTTPIKNSILSAISKGLSTGKSIELKDTPVYASSTASSYGKKTGTYFIWSNEVVNGRIRITNSLANVGVPNKVTCWIDAKTTTSINTIKNGDIVRLKKGSKTVDGTSLASFIYDRDHIVKKISDGKAVIYYNNIAVAKVYVSDLTLVKSI